MSNKMKNNPFRGARRWVVAGTDLPASEAPISRDGRQALKYGRGYERIAASNGEINAYSKNDLAHRIGQMLLEARSGDIRQTMAPATAQQAEERTAMLIEAFNDVSGDSMLRLGESFGDEVWITLGREGLARRMYMSNTIPKGGIGRLRVRQKDVVAIVSTTAVNVDETVVRQKYVFPGIFYLMANILIETKEIEQAPGELMDDKFMDGLEQILVQEDLVWKRQVDRGATLSNDLVYFDTLTPAVWATLRNQIGRWTIPPTSAVIAYDLWTDITTGDEFSAWYDPVSKHSVVLEGSLARIRDVDIITDGFRHETLQVLQPGEIYMNSAPQTVGGIVQLFELQTDPINQYNLGKPVRGWFMQQAQGMALVNPRGVSKGQRA